MAYLRAKLINGKTYFYLVESRRINGKVRQKVIKYIGTQGKLGKLLQGNPGKLSQSKHGKR